MLRSDTIDLSITVSNGSGTTKINKLFRINRIAISTLSSNSYSISMYDKDGFGVMGTSGLVGSTVIHGDIICTQPPINIQISGTDGAYSIRLSVESVI